MSLSDSSEEPTLKSSLSLSSSDSSIIFLLLAGAGAFLAFARTGAFTAFTGAFTGAFFVLAGAAFLDAFISGALVVVTSSTNVFIEVCLVVVGLERFGPGVTLTGSKLSKSNEDISSSTQFFGDERFLGTAAFVFAIDLFFIFGTGDTCSCMANLSESGTMSSSSELSSNNMAGSSAVLTCKESAFEVSVSCDNCNGSSMISTVDSTSLVAKIGFFFTRGAFFFAGALLFFFGVFPRPFLFDAMSSSSSSAAISSWLSISSKDTSIS
mmetsp:Transcript_14938/g.29860  ORF Transcript_14938/g.29860 Transcript_14938/m.29860 type:complete len:267 (-) Transcript_14938:3892-4692(-)